MYINAKGKKTFPAVECTYTVGTCMLYDLLGLYTYIAQSYRGIRASDDKA